MPVPKPYAEGFPDADDVRGALERILASDAFRASPQLAAFLRYVVEATLRGEADRIKGYTIAVEALGRGDDFDPQINPIVRVEAIRLRRAVNRYYANAGGRDQVVIELPLGSYVPVFRRGAVPALVPPPGSESARRRVRFKLPRVDWRHAIAALALILFGASLYGGLDFWLDFNAPQPAPVLPSAQTHASPDPWRGAPAYPVVFVGTFQAARNNAEAPAEMLRAKLRDALARFDEIQVVSGPLPPRERGRASAGEGAPSRYGLSAWVETAQSGTVNLSIRLTDEFNDSVAYAHTFSRAARDNDGASAEDAIIREVSAALAQPYGIIQARERAKEALSGEPRYHCLLEAYAYWRNYDPQQHRRARDCLEHATAVSPGFALGHAALAPLLLEEYRNGVNPRPGEAPPLQRALQAARRAVELKPGSARAHQALADVQFARADYPLAIETGERAMLLNPYDPNILADYGADLIALGEQERGARLIKDAAAALVVRPAWHDFFLFLSAYLAGDHAGAARYAALTPSDTYPLGLVARALVAAHRGEAENARQLLDRLATLRPAWRDDRENELRKFFPAEAIVQRLMRDLGHIRVAAGR